MNKIKIMLFVVATLSSSSVLGRCEGDNKTIFSCATKDEKQIEVCDVKGDIAYSFGKQQGKPEILVMVSRNEASINQWDGMGRYESYSVDIPNGNTIYNVFWGMDRLEEDHPVEAGVNVFVNKKSMAIVKCIGVDIVNNIPRIELHTTENMRVSEQDAASRENILQEGNPKADRNDYSPPLQTTKKSVVAYTTNNKSIASFFGWVGIACLALLAILEPKAPKRDGRFKTGYKNNEAPLKKSPTVIKTQIFAVVTGIISALLWNFLG
ncbi:MAG: hypothetical protein HOO95_07825 [Gallionella sp.]|nr:hypothetical protein [Gallionella sp.]